MCCFRFGNIFWNGSCDVSCLRHISQHTWRKRVYTVEVNKYTRMMSNVSIFDNVQRQLLAKYYRKTHLLPNKILGKHTFVQADGVIFDSFFQFTVFLIHWSISPYLLLWDIAFITLSKSFWFRMRRPSVSQVPQSGMKPKSFFLWTQVRWKTYFFRTC
jgi:hypothetical protein